MQVRTWLTILVAVVIAERVLHRVLLNPGTSGGGVRSWVWGASHPRVHNTSTDVSLFYPHSASGVRAWGGGDWLVKQTFVGMPEILLPAQSKHQCTSVPRSMSEVMPRSIRPRHSRVVVDIRCSPAPDTLDSGMCLHFPSAKRKEVACLPSLIILGFQKCGTGELQGWLSVHPVLQRWQGNEPKKSGAGEADYFNRNGQSATAIKKTWINKYLKGGFVMFKASDISRVYTFEKSPK